ncbi:MAG: TspO/MBR family protein [Pseudomonadota bacterium]
MEDIALVPALVAGAVALACAVAGGVLTRLGPWYDQLRKPSFQPPDWLFGPAWTVIFTLTAIAGYRAWMGAAPADATWILALFLVNALLNAAWSGFFFTMRRPDWALCEVALLWLSIIVLIVAIWPIDLTAAALLIPYLFWVSFAAVLNLAVVRLNAPFGAKTASE